MIRPLADRVVIEPKAAETQTASGLYSRCGWSWQEGRAEGGKDRGCSYLRRIVRHRGVGGRKGLPYHEAV